MSDIGTPDYVPPDDHARLKEAVPRAVNALADAMEHNKLLHEKVARLEAELDDQAASLTYFRRLYPNGPPPGVASRLELEDKLKAEQEYSKDVARANMGLAAEIAKLREEVKRLKDENILEQKHAARLFAKADGQLGLWRPVVEAAVAWVEWREKQWLNSIKPPPMIQALIDAVAAMKLAQKGGSDEVSK